MTPPAPDAPTLQIGAVAERTGLSIRTLRHYEDVGLLPPSGRSVGGFRLYTPDDVSRLGLIRRMKPLGFSLTEMASLLEATDNHHRRPTKDTAAAMATYVRAASKRRDDLAAQVATADEFISQLRQLCKQSPAT